MALTEAQRVILAADVRASTDPEVIAALAIRNDTELTRLYNEDSAFIAWRSTVSVGEYRDALDWTEVDNLTTGKSRIWDWVTGQMTLELETGKANVRAGLANCWAVNSTTRAQLLAIADRPATLAESLYATGTGSANNQGDLVFEGRVTTNDMGKALNENP